MAAKTKAKAKTTTKKATKTKTAKASENYYDLESLVDIETEIDSLEKDFDLLSTWEPSSRQPTGLLSLDLILGGGTLPGWYTYFGGEQSSKTTLATWVMLKAAIDKIVPIIQFWDFEGSFSPDYLYHIAQNVGYKGTLRDLFGVYDDKAGKWIVRPTVRKYQESVAEKFFDNLKKLQRKLPDKVKKDGDWWYVFTPTKTNKHLRDKCDEKQYKKTGNYWIPATDGNPQAIIVVDSYPAMLPRNIEKKDEGGDGLAAQARMFSEQLKRVKGELSSKKIIIIGINQMRKNPMAMYGPTETEPGGEALKFYSDVRIRMTSRSSVFGNKGLMEKERSVCGKGRDKYRYVNVKTIKNKLSIPDMETWLRIWVKDSEGKARGFDPVFDTFQFMRETGLLSATATKTRIKLQLSPVVKDWNDEKTKQIDWKTFKQLVLGDKSQIEKALKACGYTGKPFKLRQRMEKFSATAQSQELFFNQLTKKDNGEDDE